MIEAGYAPLTALVPPSFRLSDSTIMRFHALVGVLDNLPAGFLEIGDGELIVNC